MLLNCLIFTTWMFLSRHNNTIPRQIILKYHLWLVHNTTHQLKLTYFTVEKQQRLSPENISNKDYGNIKIFRKIIFVRPGDRWETIAKLSNRENLKKVHPLKHTYFDIQTNRGWDKVPKFKFIEEDWKQNIGLAWGLEALALQYYGREFWCKM